MELLEVINTKLDAVLKMQQEHSDKLEEVVENVQSLDEAIKNINLTERDYEVDCA